MPPFLALHAEIGDPLGVVAAIGPGERQQRIENRRGRHAIDALDHGATGQQVVRRPIGGHHHPPVEPSELERQAIIGLEERRLDGGGLVVEIRVAVATAHGGSEPREGEERVAKRAILREVAIDLVEPRRDLGGAVVPEQAGVQLGVGPAQDREVGAEVCRREGGVAGERLPHGAGRADREETGHEKARREAHGRRHGTGHGCSGSGKSE